MALPLFAITLFVSAFLLFLVQPMIGKMILPKLGGTPQVWNTCMVFFQSILLLGYFYSHATTNFLKTRTQMIVHGSLLVIPLILLFVYGAFNVADWDPPAGTNPIWATLQLLAIVVGVPFFVVSTSAPLLQRWFSYSGHPTAHDPYFLYGASNLGSLLSLVTYPFITEPLWEVKTQAIIWYVGYVILLVMVLASAALVWSLVKTGEQPKPALEPTDPLPSSPSIASTTAATAIQSGRVLGKKKGLKPGVAALATPDVATPAGYNPQTAAVTWFRRIRWILLAAVPSSLMLGVTSYVSTDLSPFPLVWVIPLALYLLSFILVFATWPLPWTDLPHKMFLYAFPVAIIGLCWILFSRDYSPTGPTMFSFLFVFIITMALHGELAKDRPATHRLTEFFLCMSFGGMVGGIFNAICAPILFTGVVEYPIAIALACFLRPNLFDTGFTDAYLLDNPAVRQSIRESSDKFATNIGKEPTGEPFLLSYMLDIAIGLCIALLAFLTIYNSSAVTDQFAKFLEFVGFSKQSLNSGFRNIHRIAVYGPPTIACLIVLPRSLRFGIGAVAMLFFGLYLTDRDAGRLYAGRSYFGVLRVYEDKENLRDNMGRPMFIEVDDLPPDIKSSPFTYLMHGTTYHGRNYQLPELARVSTTYYHRFGPVGCVMEKYNWFPGRQNTWKADVRLPASLIAQGAAALGGFNLPVDQIANCWSEPPFATVGLGSGTMANYCRWGQHLTYYEIDEKIRDMSLPTNGRDPFFRYVKDAMDRGGFVEIVMGDARLSLEKEAKREKLRVENKEGGPTAMRDGYYKVIVLDAFSSDAIPVHLITREAIQLYMKKLAPDGVLCVHTSNRHLALIDPVADIAADLKLDAFVAHDNGGDRTGGPRDNNRVYSLGHFSSEYIMLANKGVMDQKKLTEAIKPDEGRRTSITEWRRHPAPNRAIWTDHYQNIVSIMR